MVVVLEPTRCLIAESIDSDTAMTVLALVSEDPSSWKEAASVWPRYCSLAVREFASGIPFAETESELAIEALSGSHAWLVIDFVSGSLFTGGGFQAVGRDAAFAMVVDEKGKQSCPMSFHLPPWRELHDEFAFSMPETREAWEAQQREYEDFSAEMDRKQAERKQAQHEQGAASEPFATAWSGLLHDGAIPGDRGGYLNMAFMIGEIVSDLQRLEDEHEEIKSLNEAFANYRRSEGSFSSGTHLKEVLQTLSERHSELISKAADMQSRIDEATRPVACDDSDSDFPF